MNDTANATQNETTDADAETIIDALPHGPNEQFRITISRYQGRTRVNLRVWFRGSSGQYWPTRTGVTVSPTYLSRVAAALNEAHRRLNPPAGGPNVKTADTNATAAEA